MLQVLCLRTHLSIGVGTLFKLGGQNFLYKNCHFSRRAPYNYLSAAQLKEIDRLRCFVVIDFHIVAFHPIQKR